MLHARDEPEESSLSDDFWNNMAPSNSAVNSTGGTSDWWRMNKPDAVLTRRDGKVLGLARRSRGMVDEICVAPTR